MTPRDKLIQLLHKVEDHEFNNLSTEDAADQAIQLFVESLGEDVKLVNSFSGTNSAYAIDLQYQNRLRAEVRAKWGVK